MARSASLGTSVPVIVVVDGIPTTTSLAVAHRFGKRHRDVLRAIRNLLAQLPAEHARNFALMSLEADIGNGATRTEPLYRITRDGFTLLAMGFTGERALEFKLAYLDAFNRMEAELAQRPQALPAPDPASPHARLALTGAAQLGAEVQAEALGQLARDEWLEGGRWLLSFVRDDYRPGEYRPHVKRVEAGTFITTWRRLAENISDPAMMLGADDLGLLARACLGELERRAAHARQLEIAAHRAQLAAAGQPARAR
jgi:Rha family phage regulatory protein